MAVIVGYGSQFIGCGPTIGVSTTLTSDYNWMTIGPTTIASGVTVTINTGVTWVVV